jgi:hypothetical protein
LLFKLHDSSGSVSPTDFALGKQAAAHLLEQFGAKTHVAVAQFSSECIVECKLTDDRELAKRRNLGMDLPPLFLLSSFSLPFLSHHPPIIIPPISLSSSL